MVQLHESKVPCKAQFSNDANPAKKSPWFQGLMHLFEHSYDVTIRFRYGVLDLDWTVDEADDWTRQNGPPRAVLIRIELDGGDVIVARFTVGHVHHDPSRGDFIRLGVFEIVGVAPGQTTV